MLYSHQFIKHKHKTNINKQTFSFVDGFPDEKQQKTIAHSHARKTDFQTTSCCTSGTATDYQKDSSEVFYSYQEGTDKKEHQFTPIEYGINISKQINYRTAQQYEEILQNLLNDIKIDQQNKIYLKLIILDQQLPQDHRLQTYFDKVLEEYRIHKENTFIRTFVQR